MPNLIFIDITAFAIKIIVLIKLRETQGLQSKRLDSWPNELTCSFGGSVALNLYLTLYLY